ncbi:hypothetical protein evm_008880 [Chilo suppressalis]|nr:hypothetical protein evm_008880 [Chilo suppressalis]
MSQQRTRKPVVAEQMSRGRATTKTSGEQCLLLKNYEKKYQSGVSAGDTVPCNVQNKQRSRSKSKIPKSLRNDLENALVGLCDVWFEEIKPHLVRNNIKLHVHGARPGPASGDHKLLPPGAAGCSHIDPASTASMCELCSLLFNAANSIESAVSQAASVASPTTFTIGKAFKPETAGLYPRSSTFILSKFESRRPPQPPAKLIQLQDLTVHEAVRRKESVTALRPAPRRTHESRQQFKRSQKLFQDDLVDIIAKRSDKQLKLLYKSPPREESPSVMNLLRTGHGQLNHTTDIVKKIRPWR